MNTATQLEQSTQALAGSEFGSLLQKEFKPKTDQAREAVEAAVQTLAKQALGSAITLSNDAYQTVQAIIAEIDRKLSEQINRIIHHDDYQKLEGDWVFSISENCDSSSWLGLRWVAWRSDARRLSLGRGRAARFSCSRKASGVGMRLMLLLT